MEGRPNGARTVKFGTFELDLAAGELRKNGMKVRLQEQPFRLLALLTQRPGEVVSREELREKLWQSDTYVDFDNSLNTSASKLRDALGDSASSPRFIETLPRRGYRFLAPVQSVNDENKPPGSGQDPERETGQGSPASQLGSDLEQQNRRLRLALFAMGGLFLAVLVVLLSFWQRSPDLADSQLLRFSLLRDDLRSQPAISPDGRHVAFIAGPGNGRLWIWDLDREEPRELEGTDGAVVPFWSPDSAEVGFFVGRELKRISSQGGAVATLCQMPAQLRLMGSWSEDGSTIVFSSGNPGRIYEVSAMGGKPKLLIQPEESEKNRNFFAPVLLPTSNGQRALVFLIGERTANQLVIQDLATGEREILSAEANRPAYCSSGHLLYTAKGMLWALPFSADSLTSQGEAFPVRERPGFTSVSREGTLLHQKGGVNAYRIVWRDREGNRLGDIGQPQPRMGYAALSPDQRHAAVRATEEGNSDIWIHDSLGATKTRLTTDPTDDYRPVWDPKGERIAFVSNRDDNWDIFAQPVPGSGSAIPLVASPLHEFVTDWSRDERFIIYFVVDPPNSDDLWYLKRKDDDSGFEPIPFLQTPFAERDGKLSPDSRFLAYVSGESNRFEVYVQPFPEGGQRWLVSQNGGVNPLWRKDGREMFYVEGDTLMALPVTTNPTFSAGTPTPLFAHPSLTPQRSPTYDVSGDGQRFILMEPAGESEPVAIQVVQNWYEEFRDREQ